VAQQAWQRDQNQARQHDATPVRPATSGTAHVTQGTGPRDSATRDSAPRDGATRDNTPRDSAPRDNTPRDSAPRDNTSRDSGTHPVRLTSRGAVLVMVCVFGLGFLLASLFGATVVTGFAFVLGAAVAARYTKQADLLTVAVSPPLAFFCVLVLVKAVTASGNVLVSVLEGCALTLASLAPWLFIGVAVNFVIASVRGLPRCVGELRRSLHPATATTRASGKPLTGTGERPSAS
jgi:uncharacterized protein DUF6542